MTAKAPNSYESPPCSSREAPNYGKGNQLLRPDWYRGATFVRKTLSKANGIGTCQL